MKLNNKKNITLCQKALSTKELAYYASLCVTYNKLAQLSQDQHSTSSPIRIEQRYSRALTNASKGNLDFLDDPECIFTDEESKLLRNYSIYATKLKNFQKASDLLKEALPTPDSDIDYNMLNKYSHYMDKTSYQTKTFNEDISKHSRTFIGHSFYKLAQKSINQIQQVDRNHLPHSLKQLSPELYGAEISGYTTIRQLLRDADSMFTEKETEQYDQEFDTPKVAKEVAYMASNKVATVLHDHKKQILTAILAASISAAAYQGAKIGYDQVIQHNQAVSTNEEKGYKQPFSENLVESVKQLKTDVQEISHYNITSLSPEQAQKLADVRENEDTIISDYMSEVGQKYCEKYGYEFINATNRYDKNSVDRPYYLILDYINKDGLETSKILDSFDGDIQKTCEWEKTLDGSPTIKDLVNIANGIDKLAGKDVKFSKILGVSTTASEKVNEIEIEKEGNDNTIVNDNRDER